MKEKRSLGWEAIENWTIYAIIKTALVRMKLTKRILALIYDVESST